MVGVAGRQAAFFLILLVFISAPSSWPVAVPAQERTTEAMFPNRSLRWSTRRRTLPPADPGLVLATCDRAWPDEQAHAGDSGPTASAHEFGR